MGKLNIVLLVMVCLAGAWSLPGFCTEIKDYSNDPAFSGYSIDPEYYNELVRDGFIPTLPELSDMELVQKLNLDLPELASVKSAVEKKDESALESALAGYLNMRLPPAHVTVTDKPAPNAKVADEWLQPELIRKEKTYPLTEHINWFLGNKGCEMNLISQWYFTPPLVEAYMSSGDSRYAQRLLTFARDFYHTGGRPPAQRPATWSGCHGPWQSGGLHTRLTYLTMTYRAIGASPLVTDADRVVFLKMFWEHCDALYQLADRPTLHNFAFAIVQLLDKAAIFPDFRDSPQWKERCRTFFGNLAEGVILDDGGGMERTGYGFHGPAFGNVYTKFRNAGVTPPEDFSQRVEKAFEYIIFLPTPTWLCPVFGHGNPISYQGHMSGGVELFPEREDFAYVVSGGKKGKPPVWTARDFWHTGTAMMRSDWSQDALYMAMNYNATPWGVDQHPELLSFALQANGRLYMTNPGTTQDYGLPEEANWDEQTIAANTVTVDHESQKTMDNGGRFESWENLPGFGYLAAVSRGYEWLGVRHRRAVLFMKPLASPGPKHGYWVVYDRMDSDGQPHEYRWTGHFQPMELKVDAFTKMVETSAENGNRFYLKSAEPYGNYGFEQGSGPIQGVSGQGGSVITTGPYISLVRSSAGPVAFKVLLYPATRDDQAPVIEPLPMLEGEQATSSIPHQEACSARHTEEAVGFRVLQGTLEDYLVMAQGPGLRTYGRWGFGLVTDGEVANLRRDDGKVLEAGLVRGQRLSTPDRALIEASPAIAAVHVRYVGDKAEVTTRGVGKLAIAKLSAKEATLNGKPVAVTETNGMLNITVPAVPSLTLTAPVFSNDAKALCRAVGVPYGPDLGPNQWGSYNKGPENSVLVKWDSSAKADAEVEYRNAKSRVWKRSVHGELLINHRFVVSEIEPGKAYEFRIICRSEEGALATTMVSYRGKATR